MRSRGVVVMLALILATIATAGGWIGLPEAPHQALEGGDLRGENR